MPHGASCSPSLQGTRCSPPSGGHGRWGTRSRQRLAGPYRLCTSSCQSARTAGDHCQSREAVKTSPVRSEGTPQLGRCLTQAQDRSRSRSHCVVQVARQRSTHSHLHVRCPAQPQSPRRHPAQRGRSGEGQACPAQSEVQQETAHHVGCVPQKPPSRRGRFPRRSPGASIRAALAQFEGVTEIAPGRAGDECAALVGRWYAQACTCYRRHRIRDRTI